MTLVEVLADLYSLPPSEVGRWPEPVQEVLHRNAIHRGWLVPSTGSSTGVSCEAASYEATLTAVDIKECA